MTHRIGVIGSGSWGTALAVHLAHTGHDVRLWARDAALAIEMSGSRENRAYLPGIELPSALAPTSDMRLALDGAQFVVIAVPSHGVRDVTRLANAHLPNGCAIVSATKGLEEGSLLRMS
jgi:glycerol-3-phosphate dehydrogenase (NAD(P)+)